MRLRSLLTGLLLAVPLAAAAQNGDPIKVGTGVTTSIPTILAGLLNTILLWSTTIATTLFLAGAFVLVASHGEETFITAGKKLMKSAVIGLIIVLCSWMILSTIFYFIAA